MRKKERGQDERQREDIFHTCQLKLSLSPPRFTSSILVAKVREPPDVSQADDLPRHGQEELSLAGPLAPGMQAVFFGGRFPVGQAPLVEVVQQRVSLLWRHFVDHHRFWQRHTHTPVERETKEV